MHKTDLIGISKKRRILSFTNYSCCLVQISFRLSFRKLKKLLPKPRFSR